ncbi:MAG: prepilin peptidase [Actinomycetota bacterium]|nr:prepilin peptidase [Actinomycetota bacterium]
MPIAIAAVGGLVAGSFLNVVIARLPNRRSLMRPRSHCPGCLTPIRPYDNVPVLSWLLLRGRCRSCGESISPRYPLVEAATAGLCALVIVERGTGWQGWLGIAMVLMLVPVAFIDLEHRIIPNRILLPGALAAVAIVAAGQPGRLPEHLIAGAAAGGFLLLAVLAYPRGMGMGDVKLAAVLGLFLGKSVAPAMLAALLSGSLLGAAIIARKGAQEGRKTAIPFGPFLALGAVVGLFAGPAMVDWYRHTFL